VPSQAILRAQPSATLCHTLSAAQKSPAITAVRKPVPNLDRFLQIYAVEKARAEARKKGYASTEQALADGSIKLVIQVQGGTV
jgi:hypothetical protein